MNKIVIVNLPDIGEGVVEGEVIEWRKKEGEAVAKDEAVVVVMTDKATVELPSPVAGIFAKKYFEPGGIATRGKPLYEIETTNEQAQPSSPEKTSQNYSQPTQPFIVQQPLPSFTEVKRESSAQRLATPAVRKLAKELGVLIDEVEGTGKEGRVTETDVVHFHAQSAPRRPFLNRGKRAAPEIFSSTPIQHMPDDDELPLIGLRHTVAEKMVESKYIIPHYSYFDQADATRLVLLREKISEEAKKDAIRVTYMPFFIRSLSLALKKYPQVNGSVDLNENKLVIHKHHHIGIAKSTPSGLVVCVLKNVQNMSLEKIIRDYHALMHKANTGKLERSDLQDSTITISNFGVLGGMWATPIINYPEIAILGIAKIRQMPIVKNNEITIREMVNLSWSFDHRVIDGEGAAQFSNTVISFIENPAQLL